MTDSDYNSAGLRIKKVTSRGFYIAMQEQEASAGSHAAETTGYFAIIPYNGQEDCDNDGLTNEEETSFHTHPGLWDTDQDGISDGKEYRQSLNSGVKSNRLNAETVSSVFSLFNKTLSRTYNN